jgi:hypothetical protein
MTPNFAVRFQTKYATLGEAWRQFARGEVPESFLPEWRGVNYYASVFSNETEPRVRVAAQGFLSALDAARFDARTYIARLTLATQAFAQAVCQSAGLKWELASPSGQGIRAAWPLAAEKRGPPANWPRWPVTPPAPSQPANEPAPKPVTIVSAEKQLAGRASSGASVSKKAKMGGRAKPAKGAAARKSATSKRLVKSKSAPKTDKKPAAAKLGTQPAKRKAPKPALSPKPAKQRKPVKRPVKPKPSAAKLSAAKKRKT